MQTVKHSVGLRRFVWLAGIGLVLMSVSFGFKTAAALGTQGPAKFYKSTLGNYPAIF